MRRRELGRTGIDVTELSFGAASLGNMFQIVDEATAHGAVCAAWDAGIRYFDTAPHYGLGLSERRLGSALSAYPRDEMVISSKVGRRLERNLHPVGLDPAGFVVPDTDVRRWDFSDAGVTETIESSLQRLQTDYLDIAYLHDPELAPEGSLESGLEALSRLKRRGVVRAIGVGTNDARTAIAALEHLELDVVMIAGRVSLLDHELMPAVVAAASGRGIVAAGVFNSGLLARDRPDPDARFDYSVAPPELIRHAHHLADICAEVGTSLPAAAIAYPLRTTEVSTVTVGCRTAAHVERNVELYEAGVPEHLWGLIEARPFAASTPS